MENVLSSLLIIGRVAEHARGSPAPNPPRRLPRPSPAACYVRENVEWISNERVFSVVYRGWVIERESYDELVSVVAEYLKNDYG